MFAGVADPTEPARTERKTAEEGGQDDRGRFDLAADEQRDFARPDHLVDECRGSGEQGER